MNDRQCFAAFTGINGKKYGNNIIVHSKVNILSLFIHPHVVSNLFGFLFSVS